MFEFEFEFEFAFAISWLKLFPMTHPAKRAMLPVGNEGMEGI